MLLAEAHPIAAGIMQQLQPACQRIHIAGSLRRMCPQIGDIEIVCLPKFFEHRNKDLFGNEVVTNNLSPVFKDKVAALGKVELGKVGHRYMKIQLPESICLDLFTPNYEDYYRQLAIRTGNSVYSRNFIAAAWVREGWCGTDDGLRRRSECKQKGTNNWVCERPKPTLPPVWQDEIEFFSWLKLTYLPPELREM